jgi:hypothetical protein
MKTLVKNIFVVSFGVVFCGSVGHSQNYAVDWHTLPGGGGTSTNNTFTVSGTIGQSDAGALLTDGYYSVDQGFWGAIAAVQVPGAPRLGLVLVNSFGILSWPIVPAGFGLQQSSSVSAPAWVNVTNIPIQVGDQWQVTVPVSGARFYRLKNHLPSETIVVGAGSAVITSPFVYSGGYISQSVQTTDPNAGGRAAFSVNLTATATWLVSGVINAPDDSANSLFLNVDAEPQDPLMIWDVIPTTGFEERPGSWRGEGGGPKIFNLAAGTHTVVVRGREANAQLQSINIRPYP